MCIAYCLKGIGDGYITSTDLTWSGGAQKDTVTCTAVDIDKEHWASCDGDEEGAHQYNGG